MDGSPILLGILSPSSPSIILPSYVPRQADTWSNLVALTYIGSRILVLREALDGLTAVGGRVAVAPGVLPDLAVDVGQREDPDERDQAGHEGVEEPVVARGAAEGAPAEDVAEQRRSDGVVAALKPAERAAGHGVGRRDRVPFLDDARDLGLRHVLAREAGAADRGRVDDVNLDVLRVHLELLGEGVGEGAQGALGRVVGPVADAGEEGEHGGGEDEVLGLGDDGGVGAAPQAQDRVRHLSAAPEVDVHLRPRERQRRLDPEVRSRSARHAPHDVEGLIVVPGHGAG